MRERKILKGIYAEKTSKKDDKEEQIMGYVHCILLKIYKKSNIQMVTLSRGWTAKLVLNRRPIEKIGKENDG